jgi:flavin-dependent dehydrogenase
VILTSRRGGFDSHFDDFAALVDRVKGCPHGPDRAAGPLRQKVRARAAGRVLLVGDAAGYVDALTGEGVAVGLATAREAVAAIVDSRPADYPAAWRRVTRRYRWSSSALVGVAARPALRRRLVPAASALPAVFGWAVDSVA